MIQHVKGHGGASTRAKTCGHAGGMKSTMFETIFPPTVLSILVAWILLNQTAMAINIDLARDRVYLLIYLPNDIRWYTYACTCTSTCNSIQVYIIHMYICTKTHTCKYVPLYINWALPCTKCGVPLDRKLSTSPTMNWRCAPRAEYVVGVFCYCSCDWSQPYGSLLMTRYWCYNHEIWLLLINFHKQPL